MSFARTFKNLLNQSQVNKSNLKLVINTKYLAQKIKPAKQDAGLPLLTKWLFSGKPLRALKQKRPDIPAFSHF